MPRIHGCCVASVALLMATIDAGRVYDIFLLAVIGYAIATISRCNIRCKIRSVCGNDMHVHVDAAMPGIIVGPAFNMPVLHFYVCML